MSIINQTMEPFSVYTLLTKSDYRKYLYSVMYKRLSYLLISVCGLLLVVSEALQYFQIYSIYDNSFSLPYFLLGCLFLIYPSIIVLIMYRQFVSNPKLQHPIQYTFSEESILVKGTSFESKLDWSYITKYKEWSGYLLLYTNNKTAFFIKENLLNVEEKAFIKQKLNIKK